MSKVKEVPIYEKMSLSIEEAAAYSGIGQHKIREMIEDIDCDFVLRVGTKKSLIKRKKFEEYILARLEI